MLHTRSKIGKFVVTKRIVNGVYAAVYRARDTITGTDVALKVPHERYGKGDDLEDFRREVRLAAKLDHPNILPVREAGFAEDVFYIACPLGSESLADRMQRRLSAKTMLSFADQMLAGLAYAHSKRVLHCDVKPENFIIFPDNQIKLADFGIAKIALRTVHGSGSGTVGYLAPEQALGRPSLRSDVFAMGLVIYRMFSGVVPEWPFHWPPPGIVKARRIARPPLLDVLRRSMEVDAAKRYADAGKMHAAFRRIRARAIANGAIRTKSRRKPHMTNGWRGVRQAEFMRRYRKSLEVKDTCAKCDGPMAENMQGCPWCGTKRKPHKGGQRFRESCPRCKRSVKTDWRFCPHCYGPAINLEAEPRFSDRRYAGRCDNPNCAGKELMPFMQYCPWCRRKVRKRWRVEGSTSKCRRCNWGVLPDYWEYCPWCVTAIRKR